MILMDSFDKEIINWCSVQRRFYSIKSNKISGVLSWDASPHIKSGRQLLIGANLLGVWDDE